ncbi:MAG: hypothetical protein WB778_05410 [Thermoplasmata archaeon]
MVVASLSLGALVGILLSGGFIYWEIGNYATPQVPETLFEERKVVFAYTAGLFVGVPLALPLIFYITALSNDALPGAALFLAILVIGTEVAQWGLLRTVYFGRAPASPFYALGFRAGIGGVLVLALVTQYLSGFSITPLGIVVILLESLAIVLLEVAGTLLSLRAPAGSGRTGGGPISGGLIQVVGFFLVGFGALLGIVYGAAAALIAILGAYWIYFRIRGVLRTIPPPGGSSPPKAPLPKGSYGRTDD